MGWFKDWQENRTIRKSAKLDYKESKNEIRQYGRSDRANMRTNSRDFRNEQKYGFKSTMAENGMDPNAFWGDAFRGGGEGLGDAFTGFAGIMNPVSGLMGEGNPLSKFFDNRKDTQGEKSDSMSLLIMVAIGLFGFLMFNKK